VKICGVTDLADARLAADLGAWAVGLIFHPPSPRACDPAVAREIAAALRRRTEIVGVFVNASLDEVAGIADGVGLTMVQLHGDEGPAYCAEVARRTGCKVVKAVQVAGHADVRALRAFHTDFHLLDTHARDVRGGTGETFDWELAREQRGAPLIVSGGLTADNVGAAIARSTPFAVDVASGVEAAPGRKDPARLEAFFGAVREAGAAAPAPT
jgi:phosphoribosylanthranilate isomerase